ncbi:MAG: nucleotidyltransferase domain-containing protein [Peptococcaceae bacterium]|jgi:hypothetical protein|nr:nucleotidyltransferase domain-containing protein [Peptococcaceae bacterium]
MLDKSSVIDYATRYAEAVAREFNPVQIVLFGSYVSGNPAAGSDIESPLFSTHSMVIVGLSNRGCVG